MSFAFINLFSLVFVGVFNIFKCIFLLKYFLTFTLEYGSFCNLYISVLSRVVIFMQLTVNRTNMFCICFANKQGKGKNKNSKVNKSVFNNDFFFVSHFVRVLVQSAQALW